MLEQEFEYVNTELLQQTSLIRFAEAIGYDPVYNFDTDRVVRFRNEKLRKRGEEYRSVRSMIRLHNFAAEDLWKYMSTVNMDFQNFVNSPQGIPAIATLFAGSCKILEKVKGFHKKGYGFKVPDIKSDNMIRFMTDIDEQNYGKMFQ